LKEEPPDVAVVAPIFDGVTVVTVAGKKEVVPEIVTGLMVKTLPLELEALFLQINTRIIKEVPLATLTLAGNEKVNTFAAVIENKEADGPAFAVAPLLVVLGVKPVKVAPPSTE
jgi:hypothetical protein